MEKSQNMDQDRAVFMKGSQNCQSRIVVQKRSFRSHRSSCHKWTGACCRCMTKQYCIHTVCCPACLQTLL